jgi:hypothetical protein
MSDCQRYNQLAEIDRVHADWLMTGYIIGAYTWGPTVHPSLTVGMASEFMRKHCSKNSAHDFYDGMSDLFHEFGTPGTETLNDY